MNRSPLYSLCYIAFGLLIGSAIGICGYLRIIPKGVMQGIPAIAVGLGVIIIDLLFVWGLINRVRNIGIYKKGIPTTGRIDEVTETPHPKDLLEDEFCRRCSYVCVISYSALGREYRKELPPTCYISKKELYPFEFVKGNEIPVKISEKHPAFLVIDIDKLARSYRAIAKNDLFFLISIPVTVTLLFVIALIVL